MKKFWFPIIMVMVISAIYGGVALASAKKSNPQVTKESAPVQTTTSSTVEEPVIRTTSVLEPSEINTPVSTPTLVPTSTSTPTPTPTLKQHRSSSVSNPTPTPVPTLVQTPYDQANIEIQGLGNYKVNLKENDTAFSVLERASTENNFSLSYQNYDGLGAFIDCIGGICGGQDNKYWMFYYNGQFSAVGASSQKVLANNTTTWKFE